jgi:hypothetical protein
MSRKSLRTQIQDWIHILAATNSAAFKFFYDQRKFFQSLTLRTNYVSIALYEMARRSGTTPAISPKSQNSESEKTKNSPITSQSIKRLSL